MNGKKPGDLLDVYVTGITVRVRGSRRSPTDTKVILLLAQYQRVFFATLFYPPVVSRSLCPFLSNVSLPLFFIFGPCAPLWDLFIPACRHK